MRELRRERASGPARPDESEKALKVAKEEKILPVRKKKVDRHDAATMIRDPNAANRKVLAAQSWGPRSLKTESYVRFRRI